MWTTIAVSSLLAALLLGGASVLPRLQLGPFRDTWWLPPIRLRPEAAARFGQVASTPVALGLLVDADGGGALAGAGRMAARAFFTGPAPGGTNRPPLSLRTVAATLRPVGRARRGGWADPGSPWHAVLFGAVEVQVPAAAPAFAHGAGGELVPDELARLMAVLWAYLADYVYGVPLGALAACEAIDPARLGITVAPGQPWQGDAWDLVEIARLDVISPARAAADPRPLVTVDSLATRLWRFGLGTNPPSQAITTSFAPIALRFRLRVGRRRARHPDLGDQTITTVLVASAPAAAPEADALLAAEEQALADWWAALSRQEADRN